MRNLSGHKQMLKTINTNHLYNDLKFRNSHFTDEDKRKKKH